MAMGQDEPDNFRQARDAALGDFEAKVAELLAAADLTPVEHAEILLGFGIGLLNLSAGKAATAALLANYAKQVLAEAEAEAEPRALQ